MLCHGTLGNEVQSVESLNRNYRLDVTAASTRSHTMQRRTTDDPLRQWRPKTERRNRTKNKPNKQQIIRSHWTHSNERRFTIIFTYNWRQYSRSVLCLAAMPTTQLFAKNRIASLEQLNEKIAKQILLFVWRLSKCFCRFFFSSLFCCCRFRIIQTNQILSPYGAALYRTNTNTETATKVLHSIVWIISTWKRRDDERPNGFHKHCELNVSVHSLCAPSLIQ